MLETDVNLEAQMENLSMSSLPTEENTTIEDVEVENDVVDTAPATEDIQVADLKLSSEEGTGLIPHEHDKENTDASVPTLPVKAEETTLPSVSKKENVEPEVPLVPFDVAKYRDSMSKEEDSTTEMLGGAKQALGETIGIVKGVKSATYDLPLALPTIIGGAKVLGEFISDWTMYGAKNAVDYARVELFDVQAKHNASSPQEFSLRTNPVADAYELVFQTKFKQTAGEEWLKEFEKPFRTTDKERDRGWVDKVIYHTSSFIGELAAYPITGTSKARALADLPTDKVVDYFYGLVKGGKPLNSITNPEVKKAVSKLLMTSPKDMPVRSISVRNQVFTTLKQGRYHMKDALDYSLAAGIFTAGAYGIMRKLGYSEEESDKMAPIAGIFGMFTGTAPFRAGAKSFFSHTVSKIPTPFRLDGEKVTVGDIAMSGFKIRHLLKVQSFQNEKNFEKANYHMLRYSGATDKEAKLLSGNSEKSRIYLKDKVNKKMIEDAVTFTQMLQKLASTHPEYYNYISDARDRAIVTKARFKDIFIDNPAQRQKMKDVFETDFREKNKMSQIYTEDELTSMIDNFDVHDTEMVLDQLYMVEFLTGIRNMALSSSTIKTFTQKESIDLFTEGWNYNQAVLGQIDLIKSALKSLRSVSDISESSVDFLSKIDDAYASYYNDAKIAQTTIQQQMKNVVTSAKTQVSNDYLNTVDNLANRPESVNNGMTVTETEESVFQNMIDSGLENKAEIIRTFSNQYERIYRDVDIPDGTSSAEAARMLKEAPLIEIDASNIMTKLDRIVDEKILPATIGNTGVSPTQSITGGSKLDRFKSKVRLNGIIEQFSIDDLASSSISEIEDIAEGLISRTEGVYTSIKELDPNYFINNKNIPDITSPDSSPIKKILNNSGEYANEEAFKTDLIRAIQEQTQGVANLKGSDSSFNPEGIDEILNLFSKPKISIEDAHTIAKGFFRTARESNALTNSSKRSQNNTLGFAFIDAIDQGSLKTISTSSKMGEIKEISAAYNAAVPQVYNKGAGKVFLNYAGNTKNVDNPMTQRTAFNSFFTNDNPSLSFKQFEKIYPDTPTGNRKEAEKVLKFALGRYLQSGGKLSDLGGGDFQGFKDSFEKVLGKENMDSLEKSLAFQNKELKEVFGADIDAAERQFDIAFKNLTQESTEVLQKSLLGDLQNRRTIGPKDIVDLVFGGQAGRRVLREKNDVTTLNEDTVRQTTSDVGLNSSNVDTLLTEAQMPLANKGPWSNTKVNGNVISILLEENPAFKEPLKNMILQRFIEQSFVPTTTKTYSRVDGTLQLEQDLDIVTFSQIFNNNTKALGEIFDENELSAIQTLFESGVIAAGKNKTRKMLNIATEPTTQSRASRLFALQRKVVGMPYLATEQSVMAFQREKAAFLKRIVLDTDFANLLMTTAIEGNITRTNTLKYIQYLRVEYGEGIEDYDAQDLTQGLLKEYNTYNNPDNQNKNIDIGLTVEDTEGFSMKNLMDIRENIQDKYGLKVMIPMILATNPYIISNSILDLNTAERRKLTEKAATSKLFGEMKANESKRSDIRDQLTGSQGTY